MVKKTDQANNTVFVDTGKGKATALRSMSWAWAARGPLNRSPKQKRREMAEPRAPEEEGLSGHGRPRTGVWDTSSMSHTHTLGHTYPPALTRTPRQWPQGHCLEPRNVGTKPNGPSMRNSSGTFTAHPRTGRCQAVKTKEDALSTQIGKVSKTRNQVRRTKPGQAGTERSHARPATWACDGRFSLQVSYRRWDGGSCLPFRSRCVSCSVEGRKKKENACVLTHSLTHIHTHTTQSPTSKSFSTAPAYLCWFVQFYVHFTKHRKLLTFPCEIFCHQGCDMDIAHCRLQQETHASESLFIQHVKMLVDRNLMTVCTYVRSQGTNSCS